MCNGIYYHVFSKNIEIEGHQNIYFQEKILQCREYMKHQLEIQYKNEVSDFLKGMLIGDKNGLSDEVKDDFKESGLIHLLAVSGLHICSVLQSVPQTLSTLRSPLPSDLPTSA